MEMRISLILVLPLFRTKKMKSRALYYKRPRNNTIVYGRSDNKFRHVFNSVRKLRSSNSARTGPPTHVRPTSKSPGHRRGPCSSARGGAGERGGGEGGTRGGPQLPGGSFCIKARGGERPVLSPHLLASQTTPQDNMAAKVGLQRSPSSGCGVTHFGIHRALQPATVPRKTVQ